MLCGDGCPAFTRDDVVRFTEPKLGYSRDSPAFEKFVNVLVGFNAKERKAFLQFTTGCSSLPPGKFDIVEKLIYDNLATLNLDSTRWICTFTFLSSCLFQNSYILYLLEIFAVKIYFI